MRSIIEGFDEDFQTITEKFTRFSLELKLTDFFKFWHEESLDLLFANRFDPRELLEAITEINQKLVWRLVETDESQQDASSQVALYLLLCISVKQPERFRRKIRMSCDDVVNIQSKCSSNWKDKPDALFAWKRLRSLGALDIVEERTFYGPSLLNNRNMKKVPEGGAPSVDLHEEEKKDTIAFLESKLEPDLQDLEATLAQYDYVKQGVEMRNEQEDTTDGPKLSVNDCLSQARALLADYKASLGRS